jgi:hypothetical protein
LSIVTLLRDEVYTGFPLRTHVADRVNAGLTELLDRRERGNADSEEQTFPPLGDTSEEVSVPLLIIAG